MTDRNDAAEVVEPAPAKINLFLHVNHRRADGYHDLDSLVVFTDFGDVVRVAPAAALALSRTGPFAAHLPGDLKDDLCIRAATQLAGRFSRDASVRISLEKNIPVAAGVGGGSADAAAVMRALCRLWELDLADQRVAEIGAELGADVPVCLQGQAALIRGVGDIVRPRKDTQRLEMLLVNPNLPLSTAQVFRAWADEADPVGQDSVQDQDFAREALRDELANTRNDLTEPAISLCPVIRDVVDTLGDLPGCELARMSGSGPTCFAIFETVAACEGAAKSLIEARPDWWMHPT